ncbi:Hypothetical protein CINCED_3A019828, partial [Cinara cedri]
HWMKLSEDFKKILVNSRLELILTRKNVDPIKKLLGQHYQQQLLHWKLKKKVWKISLVSVDKNERLKLMKNIEKEKRFFIPFRSYETYEYPQFGDSKKKNSENYSKFEHCNLINVKVYLNSVMYPYKDLNLDF